MGRVSNTGIEVQDIRLRERICARQLMLLKRVIMSRTLQSKVILPKEELKKEH